MSLERKPSRSLESLYPAADRAAIDLLKAMLMFNPAKRCTAIEALEHEFLKPVRRKDMEVRKLVLLGIFLQMKQTSSYKFNSTEICQGTIG